MKILVTGATGYLGRALVPKLLDAGHKIRLLVRQSSNTDIFSGLKNIEMFYGDITLKETLKGIEKDIEYVYHLAVLGHLETVEDDQNYFDVNTKGSLNLLQQFAGCGLKKFLYTTTSAALGAIPNQIVTEDHFKPPITPYGKSKYQAELSIRKFAEKDELES